MNTSFARKVVALLTICFLMSPSAQAYKKVKCFMPQAPVLDLKGMKRVAILDFRVPGWVSQEPGKAMADYMLENLLSEDRGISAVEGSGLSGLIGGLFGKKEEGVTLIEGLSTRVFEVVERSRIETVMAELSLGQSGVVDESQATKLGDVLGIDFLITGEITLRTNDSRYRETHSRKQNKRTIEYTASCIRRKVTATASIRIMDAKTGQILETRRSTNAVTDSWCDDSSRPIREVASMAGSCVSSLAWEFTNLFSPWYELEKFELDKVKIKEFKKEADIAAKATEKHDLTRAYAIYNKLFQNDPYNPKFLYNMGVLYEISGDFLKAKEMYDGCAMLKDDKKYKKAAKRIASRANLVPFYQSLDLEIVPIDFEAAAKDRSLLAVKIKLKGKSQERYPIYAEPSTSSEVVAKVPGEIQLELIAEEGDWLKVKLIFGNKVGYVHKDQVKR